MTLLSFIGGVTVGAMFMGFCFSRSMLKFANEIQSIKNHIRAFDWGK